MAFGAHGLLLLRESERIVPGILSHRTAAAYLCPFGFRDHGIRRVVDGAEVPARLRHDVPTEVDLATTSFNTAVALTPVDALSIAGELLTAVAAQRKPKG